MTSASQVASAAAAPRCAAETAAAAAAAAPAAWHAAVLPVLVAGWLALFGPSYLALSSGLWADEANGHGPLIGGIAAWLLWQRRVALRSAVQRPAVFAGALLFGMGLAVLVLGQSQAIPTLQMAAQLPVLAGVLLLVSGWPALRLARFPLLFLVFMVPWPSSWADAVTHPLKAAVSTAAVNVLALTGHAVGQAGVVITIGPYQLLVADACAGLNSLFTLEALGLLYLSLLPQRPWTHKLALALCIPVLAFVANVVRVLLLALITLHAGEAAGRGFGHDFAAASLFLVALVLVFCTDRLLCRLPFPRPPEATP